DHGALLINYLPVTSFIKENGQIRGVIAQDAETGEEFRLHGRVVINATGVHTDRIRQMDNPSEKEMLSLSQGIHFVLDRSFLPGSHAIMIPKTEDGRVLFAVPWNDRVIIGTTDTPVHEVQLEPRPLPQEVNFLLDHAARYLSKDPTPEDVLSVYAGLRPLVKNVGTGNTAALSREHTLIVSRSGLVTITGGKWTTYRPMAEHAVDKAMEVGGLPKTTSPTRDLKLHGYQEQPDKPPFGAYGSDAPEVRKLLAEQPGWERLLHPNLPYLAGEVIWAARHELARTVEDVLARRTRALMLYARASIEIAPLVAELLAGELGFDERWQEDQVRKYTELANGYLLNPTNQAF
ncbi:MAG TPA: glycerol-3-phosphate dehydrogenase/oxidase, partial [Levilinea sp.]|nr:glycerol-3-phosphate dehydrogenase/oxidase [Levilinea sp.]